MMEERLLQDCYRIETLIGRGGMAEVYKAWDTRRQYHVAIKMLREDLAEDSEFVERFQREAQALAALSHVHIVRFYSFERDGPDAFIVMDYVPGTTLRRRILAAGGKPLPLDEVLSVTRQICSALHYAHAEKILHRDIKPGNIMIRDNGHVLVADFGIAKAADAATATTVMPGTPAYMSPEQCRSEPLDVRADVYSLGVTVYEMLAGRRPFIGEMAEFATGGTREKIRWEQLEAPPPPLRSWNPAVTDQVEAVVLKALAKRREDRWETVLDFWHAFHGALVSQESPEQVGEVLNPPDGWQLVDDAGPARSAPADRPAYTAPRPQLATLPAWAWLMVGLGLAGLVVAGVAFGSARGNGADLTPTAVVVAPSEVGGEMSAPQPSVTLDHIATEVARAQAIAGTLTASAPSATPSKTHTQRPPPTRTPAPTNTMTPLPSRTPTPTASAYPNMVYVPAGEFTMGISADLMEVVLQTCRTESGNCPRTMFDDEKPAHTVYLDAYYIDRYEVTNIEFADFVAATGHRTDAERSGKGSIDVGHRWQLVDGADWQHSTGSGRDVEARLDHPVVLVSWNDATAYCAWVGARLPTDAEWEKAARGTDSRLYPWGNTFRCDGANLDDETTIDSFSTGCRDGWMRTAPVGSFPAGVSPYGVHDMAGNVREWVSDFYDSRYYEKSPTSNPTGPAQGAMRSTRGGSWFTDRTWARLTDRRPFAPDFAVNYIGFRCARDAH